MQSIWQTHRSEYMSTSSAGPEVSTEIATRETFAETEKTLGLIHDIYTGTAPIITELEEAIVSLHGRNPSFYDRETMEDFTVLQFIKRISLESELNSNPLKGDPYSTGIFQTYGSKRLLDSKVLNFDIKDLEVLNQVRESIVGASKVKVGLLDLISTTASTGFNMVAPNYAIYKLIDYVGSQVSPEAAALILSWELVTSFIPLAPNFTGLFRFLSYGVGEGALGMVFDSTFNGKDFSVEEFKRRVKIGIPGFLNGGYLFIPILNLLRKSSVDDPVSLTKVLYAMTAIGVPIKKLEQKYLGIIEDNKERKY